MRNPHPHLAAPLLLILTLLTLTLTACTAATRLQQAGQTLFTAAKLADLKLTGIKTGPAIPVQAAPSASAPSSAPAPAPEAALAVTQLLSQGPVGVLLPITKVGETTPWWIFCPAGAMQARCEEIPPNARVTFSGQPLGHGMVLLPDRITWTAQ